MYTVAPPGVASTFKDMNMTASRCFRLFLMLALPAGCVSAARAQELKLIPAPRDVATKEGSFAVSAKTRIVVGAAHAAEDRIAAELLADEIHSAIGSRPQISTARSMPRDDETIYLGRWTDDKTLRAHFDSRNMSLEGAAEEEGYLLSADAEHVAVGAATGAGVFYAVQTLRQMVMPSGGGWAVPGAQIRDWPAMRWRGVHDDLSRGPVPTLEYMKKQIRTIAAFKMNLYSLYLENIFDYESHPMMAPKEGAITAADVKELVEYAKKYYITILPEQQAFGHLHHVLKLEQYADLGETPHGHVLAPVNERSYDFIKSLYAELVPLFPGPLLHIGADETFELGRGATKARADEVGLGRVYLEHVRRVADMLQPYNKRLLFWHDIAVSYPNLLSILPREMVPVVWKYSADASFEKDIKPFKDANFDFFVAPGANNWVHIYPDQEVAFTNIRNLVRDGQKFGALGMLNTTWDDSGEMIFAMTWPAIVFGGAASWQPGESSIDSFKNNFDWAFYRNHDDRTFMNAVESLAKSHELLRATGAGYARDANFWLDPFSESGAAYTQRILPAMHDLRIAAERALELLYRHRGKARQNADTIDAMIFAGLRLDGFGMKQQLAAETSRYYWDAYLNVTDRQRVGRNFGEITGINARLEDLRDSTTRLRALYAELWRTENKPYWLENVLVRFDVLAIGYQQKIQAIRAARAQFNEKGTLPPPEQLGFFVKPETNGNNKP